MKILMIIAAGAGVGLVMNVIDSALGIYMAESYGSLPAAIHQISSLLCGGVLYAIVNSVAEG